MTEIGVERRLKSRRAGDGGPCDSGNSTLGVTSQRRNPKHRGLGGPIRALLRSRRAMRLSPLNPLTYLFWTCTAECYDATRKHELAIEAELRALREAPNPIPHALRACGKLRATGAGR
jgi:hypothetical protein